MSKQSETHRPDGWPLHPLVAAVVLYLAAYVRAPLSGLVVAGLVVAAAAAAGMRAYWHYADYGRALQTEAGALGGLGAVTGTAWLGWLQVTGTAPLAGWGWLVVWTAGVSAWWASICLRAPAAAAIDWRPDQPAEQVPVDTRCAPYPRILADAGVTGVEVTDLETVGGGLDIVTVRPVPQPGRRPVTFTAFFGQLEVIAGRAAEHWAEHGYDLADEDVTVHRGRRASEFLLYVARARPLAGREAVPYVAPAGPTSWCGPRTLGLYEDRKPLEVTLCDEHKGARHLEGIGMSESGKGVSLNNVIADRTSSDEGEVWVVGVTKLQNLASGWLAPWLEGRTARPVLDRVAGPRVDDCLQALADAFHYTVLCNADLFGDDARVPSRGRGALFVAIDEASSLLTRKEAIMCHDGVRRNASELATAIRKEGRTGPVHLGTWNQDNLFGSSGNAGSEGKRNSAIAFVFRVRTPQDAAQPLAGLPSIVQPARLTDNMCYVETGDDSHRSVRAKFAALRGADMLAQVAEAHTPFRHGLVPEYTAQLAHYRDRWAADRHPNLARLVASRGWTWPGDRLTLATGTTPPNHPAATGPASGPATTEPPAGTTLVRPDATTPEPPVTSGNHPDQPPGDQPAAGGSNHPGGHPGHGGPNHPADHPADHRGPADADQAAAWAESDRRWLAELGIELDAGPAGPTAPAPSSGVGAHGVPTLDGSNVRELTERIVAGERDRLAGLPDPPEPLRTAAVLAGKPKAPEFIPSAVLAVAMGRVKPDAPQDERDRAAAKLGRELSACDPELEPTQRSLGTGPDGRRRRPSGFLRDDLIAAVHRFWGTSPGSAAGGKAG